MKLKLRRNNRVHPITPPTRRDTGKLTSYLVLGCMVGLIVIFMIVL